MLSAAASSTSRCLISCQRLVRLLAGGVLARAGELQRAKRPGKALFKVLAGNQPGPDARQVLFRKATLFALQLLIFLTAEGQVDRRRKTAGADGCGDLLRGQLVRVVEDLAAPGGDDDIDTLDPFELTQCVLDRADAGTAGHPLNGKLGHRGFD